MIGRGMGCEIIREIPKASCQVLEKVTVSREKRGGVFQISQSSGRFVNKVCRNRREVCGRSSFVRLGVMCCSVIKVADENVEYLLLGVWGGKVGIDVEYGQ